MAVPLPSWLAGAKLLHAGVRFDLVGLEVPGRAGGSHRREIIVHPGAVVVLPLVDDRHVALIRNHRPAAGAELWELPAGTLEPHPETPLSCAQRELIEETGYQAGRMTPLTRFYASPGIITEVMHAFVARDLKPVGQELEDSERITVHVLPLARTIDMVRTGEIQDGKTIATLLYYQCFAGG